MCTGISSIGQPSSTGTMDKPDDGNVHRDYENDGLAQVGEHPASVPNRSHEGGEVVVQQYQGGRLARHVAAPRTHRHADVGRFQRRGVIDAVAGHRDHVPAGAKGLHQPQLLFRLDPAEDVRIGKTRPQCIVTQCQRVRRR